MKTVTISDAELAERLPSLAKYFRQLTVPSPDEMPHVQELCDLSDPFGSDERTGALFAAAMRETTAWHADRSQVYRSLWERAGRPIPRQARDADSLPFVHVNLFKRHTLSSIPDVDVSVRMTSSGTGGEHTDIGFDAWSIGAAQRMDAWTLKALDLIDTEQSANYLVCGYEPAPRLTVGAAHGLSELCDFAPVASARHMLRNTGNGHELDLIGSVDALLRFAADDCPVRIVGFPAFLYTVLERLRTMGIPPLTLPEGSLVLTGGGWKSHADRAIGRDEFREVVRDRLGIPDERIRDCYGSVEHPLPYIECSEHHFHVPVWSRCVVRNVRTLEPVGYGRAGYLQFISPYITAVPAHSILMADLGTLYSSGSGCGIRTPWFEVHGRAGIRRNRSCAVAAAELLERR
ncbi:LuxE/PaaK family acyltransferase [Streptomyces demainii]|uniref:Phenylacetate-coenzyme A ligase PaaK-like adenylate-forming protein n=1 Tax=Streptomyces demainii TaxID=588122 RepID=A0ABT9L6Y3_9ACTN|nr:acyl-protein synthase [Streptomyces demainii]MDP9616472.1 phenylacetate-coenzyme A ligase PaaK-like adenylate-forming protein [Streptomyces demainii]